MAWKRRGSLNSIYVKLQNLNSRIFRYMSITNVTVVSNMLLLLVNSHPSEMLTLLITSWHDITTIYIPTLFYVKVEWNSELKTYN